MNEGSDTKLMDWPYPIRYEQESEIEADVLVLGGGLAGCFAAISAARKGLNVVLVDKGGVKRSGAAGAGNDHWMYSATNPASRISAEELAEALIKSKDGWMFDIGTYIECREGWETLLDLEQMGMKIRDTEDEFQGAVFRDEKSKLLFAYDLDNRYTIRIWGTGMKPALYRECRRLGVKMLERTSATALLTAEGEQGGRVVGATGVDTRTGEYYVFKAKSTVLCMNRPWRLWMFSSELTGSAGSQFHPFINAGEGHAMAWRAGAAFAGMEKSGPAGGGGYAHPPYGVGNARNTWYPCTIVDANGKEVPWVDKDGRVLETVEERYKTASSQRVWLMGGGPNTGKVNQDVLEPRLAFELGEFAPPFYADLPSMPEHDRRVIFGLMVAQEGKTQIPVYYNYTQAGFDPDQDMLQCYEGSWVGVGSPQWRVPGFYAGGLITDWDLMTNLEGLFCAGEQMLCGLGCAHACATGRYAGRKAAEYALNTRIGSIDRGQVESEKKRIYAPVKNKEGIEWKELEAAIAKVMQDYCGPVKNEQLLKLGLKWLEEVSEQEATQLYARNPHELVRVLELLGIITAGEMVIHASLARKASSEMLGFNRSDYPEEDPPEWHKWITTKIKDDLVQVDEQPLSSGVDMEQAYKEHSGL